MDVSDEGSLPTGGTYSNLPAEGEGGLDLGYRHRLGQWEGPYSRFMQRERWMLNVNTFPYKSSYHTVSLADSATPQQDRELREVISSPTRTNDGRINSVQLLEAGGEAKDPNTPWEFVSSSRKYETRLVGLPKVKSARVDKVKRYVGILQMSERWTGHALFASTPQRSGCTHFFSYNCLDPAALELPPASQSPSPSKTASSTPSPTMKPSSSPSVSPIVRKPAPAPAPPAEDPIIIPPPPPPKPVVEPPQGLPQPPTSNDNVKVSPSPTRSPTPKPSASSSTSPRPSRVPIYVDDDVPAPTPSPKPAAKAPMVVKVAPSPAPPPEGAPVLPPPPVDDTERPAFRTFDATVPVAARLSYSQNMTESGEFQTHELEDEDITYEQQRFMVPTN